MQECVCVCLCVCVLVFYNRKVWFRKNKQTNPHKQKQTNKPQHQHKTKQNKNKNKHQMCSDLYWNGLRSSTTLYICFITTVKECQCLHIAGFLGQPRTGEDQEVY